MKKRTRNEDKFGVGILLIILSISVTMFGFLSEERNIVGYAAGENRAINEGNAILYAYNSLSELSPGKYFVYDDGSVYSIEEYAKLFVGKVKHVQEIHKNRNLYVDRNGNVGYVLDVVENG